MGIRRYNPTTPGRRGATVSDFAELTPGAKPVKGLLVPKTQKGRPEQPGHDHRAASRRRTQAALPPDRFPPQQGRHSRGGQFDPIRSQPQRAHRLAALCRRRKAIHSGPRRAEGRRSGSKRGGRAGRGGQLPAAFGDPAWAWTFTTSKCSPAAAACCAGRRACGRHWPPATPIGRRSTCPAAKSAACRPPAGRRSAPSATPITWALCWARRGENAGWAAGRTSAARP